MKPNFALNITDSAISLLHRTPRGWLEIGSANFDAPDLDEALGYLRSSALGLSPHGITTKLILPPSQILYVEVEAAGPDKAARETQIRAALQDRTPYAVDDLVFDWWGAGPNIKVAVVARETLEEAEAFAETHRFNPVSFVTTPAEGQFAGEPWFGVTKLSTSILPEGEKVTRDQDPVKVVARDIPKAEVSAPQAADEQAPAADGKVDDKITNEDAEKTAEDAAAQATAKAEATAKSSADAKAKAMAKDIEDAKVKALAAQKQAAEEQAAEKRAAEKQAADALKAEQDRAAAEMAEAAQKAKDDAEKRAAAEAAAIAEAESIRKTEAAKAELERRAQELAQAEAKRMVVDAEKAKADQLAREKAKAALIEAERKRTDLERVAAESSTTSFDPFTGVIDQNIGDGTGRLAEETEQEATRALGMAAFASRRAEAASAAPSLGPAAVANLAKELTAASKSNASQSNNVNPGLTARKPDALAAPMVTSVAAAKPAVTPARAPALTPPQSAATSARPASTKPLNGTAAFATGAKAEMPKPAIDAIAAAKVTAARIPGAGAALARFKSKAQKSVTTAAGQAKRQAAFAKPTGTKPIGAKSIGAKSAETNTAFDKSVGALAAKTAPRRGKPRFLGLILTLILLAALAGIAAWSSLYLSRDTDAPETVQQADATAAPADGPLSGDVAADGPAADVVTPAEAQAEAEAELPPADEVAATVQPDTQPPAAEMIAGADLAETGAALAGAEGNASAEGSGLGQQDEIVLATTDQAQPSFDAVALPRPISRPDTAPTPATAPPPFGTQYEFEPDGTIKATEKGVIMPDGFWLIAAKPPVLPPARPAAISDPVSAAPPNATSDTAGDAANASTAGILRTEGMGPSSAFATDATVTNRRPKGRSTVPALAVPDDDAALATEDQAVVRLTSLRPIARPKTVLAAAEEARQAVEAASLAAKAAAAAAAAADEKTAQEQIGQDSVMTVALSPRPAARPRDFSGAVEAAIAAASRDSTRQVVAPQAVPEPEEADEPEVKVAAAPRIPTHANVAQQATFKNAINLSKTNLIGVYGAKSNRYALIRSASGRYSKVKVGDRLDGGTVAAITNTEVRYKKGSRMLSLSMPNG
ncbi:hypothetical protein ACEN2J_01635 [Pseudorhodobacter sp. W20_MBD10_FR17]|uniref:hypothetical protein n=1 Tax=Pseudorhodobacter sp. W20_MBD10_FR17 TaxID=3240266 RepID=UPI003F9AA85F